MHYMFQIGRKLDRSFEGKASNLVDCCKKSAVKPVSLVASHFPGERRKPETGAYPSAISGFEQGHEETIMGSKMKFSCIKELRYLSLTYGGAFNGQSYGEFHNIGSITMFADYIVPEVLQQLLSARYSSSLSHVIIDNTSEIALGSEEEIELRDCAVYAAEKIREFIHKNNGNYVQYIAYLLIVQVTLNNSFDSVLNKLIFVCKLAFCPVFGWNVMFVVGV
ncbi:hypothetical protein POM88_039298 [Heracleum sosnowskyi]|uniref:Queuosine 5'-phosphate N-glycosylase/hydrolase n=1 Tax=Heracleum sosnowskyi TaxID=360622 RepID=A0AAD8M8S7_9APIA|nr:hypothetical protein POM88_039298 [Heracleum sosnowskyi]